MKLYRAVFLLPLLSACAFDESSYFVRFWNGDIISESSPLEKKIFKECVKETEHLPYSTHEERNKADEIHSKCETRKKKELGIK